MKITIEIPAAQQADFESIRARAQLGARDRLTDADVVMWSLAVMAARIHNGAAEQERRAARAEAEARREEAMGWTG